jgi:hypothetical protein
MVWEELSTSLPARVDTKFRIKNYLRISIYFFLFISRNFVEISQLTFANYRRNKTENLAKISRNKITQKSSFGDG